jgi:hypothetical protein
MNTPPQSRNARGVVLLFLIAAALNGCAGLDMGASSRLTPSEKMMWSTYAVGTPKGMATCVIINRRDPSAQHGIAPVLVTAGHVLAAAPHGPYFLAIRVPNPNGNPDVAILEFKPAWYGQTAYTRHPQHDIAAIELRIPDELAGTIDLPSFIDESEVGERTDEPHPGEQVSVLGFPRVFPGTEGGFAVLRGGRIASYSPGSPRSREKFLVNTYAYSGDSGGPVFAEGGHGGKPRLVGILTERIGKKAGEVPLAVAVNATVVRETLQLLALREHQPLNKNPAGSRSGSKAKTPSTVKLAAPPEIFVKIVHGKRPAALPIPVAPRD